MSVDTAVLQIAKDNDVSIGIGLRQFLESHGLRRVRLLVNYRKLVRLCVKMRNRVVIVSDARDEFQARPPLQLEAFGVWLGLTHPQAKWSLSEVPEYIVEEAGE
jgi:RNase P/RNase MRP subunit p30